jgi:hypothetical protein
MRITLAKDWMPVKAGETQRQEKDNAETRRAQRKEGVIVTRAGREKLIGDRGRG